MSTPRRHVLFIFSFVAGCMNMDMSLPPAIPMIEPPPWDGTLATTTAPDENPDPRIVEVTITASIAETEYLPGQRVRVWAYNGSVPGPTIAANAGDRVIVHFRNQLDEDTTIHWHGLRLPNAMDGTARVMAPVPVGGTFEYDFVVPDAGTFWYHPHVRSDLQMERGLYGAIVIGDPRAASLGETTAESIVLDDVRVNVDTGALEEFIDERAMMMGREGNLVLVNGRRSNVGVVARAGERRRWRIVNAANARFFKISLVGGTMVRVGGDGGALRAPEPTGEILLTSGERADVLVSVDAPSTTATLRAEPYERASNAGATAPVDLIRLVASAQPAVTPPGLAASLADIATLDAPAVTRTLELGEKMQGHKMVFTINGAAFPNVPIVSSKTRTVERWKIVNKTDMDHPFHLHGFRFQREGVPEWKDSINVREKTTLDLLVEFDDRGGTATGGWMYHCHILEHEEGGMMAEVDVAQ